MSAATVTRASVSSSALHTSASTHKPTKHAAQTRARAMMPPAAPHPSRALAVSPSAYYCRPSASFPSIRVARSPEFYRQRQGLSPNPLFNLAFGMPTSNVTGWLARNLNEPLQPFTATTHDDRYELTSDVPGMGPDDITVEVGPEGLLRLKGERKRVQEVKGEDGSVQRQATTAYSFERSFRLPEDALAEQVAASLDKGVLTVTVPRREPEPKPQPRRVTIAVKHQHQQEEQQQQQQGQQEQGQQEASEGPDGRGPQQPQDPWGQ